MGERVVKVKGRWTYLYRARDRAGNFVDVVLSEKRDKAAAETFFRSARIVTGWGPERLTTDGHDAYPGAIKTALGVRSTSSDELLLESSSATGP